LEDPKLYTRNQSSYALLDLVERIARGSIADVFRYGRFSARVHSKTEAFNHCPASANRVNVDLLCYHLINGSMRTEKRRVDFARSRRLLFEPEPEADSMSMFDAPGMGFNERAFSFTRRNGKISPDVTEDGSECSSISLNSDADLNDPSTSDGEQEEGEGDKQDLLAHSLCAETLPTFSEQEVSDRMAAIQSAYPTAFSQVSLLRYEPSHRPNTITRPANPAPERIRNIRHLAMASALGCSGPTILRVWRSQMGLGRNETGRKFQFEK
jgi:hypothetical protein